MCGLRVNFIKFRVFFANIDGLKHNHELRVDSYKNKKRFAKYLGQALLAVESDDWTVGEFGRRGLAGRPPCTPRSTTKQ
jgi:hypothetical protein